jgi:hypothetical protein
VKSPSLRIRGQKAKLQKALQSGRGSQLQPSSECSESGSRGWGRCCQGARSQGSQRRSCQDRDTGSDRIQTSHLRLRCGNVQFLCKSCLTDRKLPLDHGLHFDFFFLFGHAESCLIATRPRTRNVKQQALGLKSQSRPSALEALCDLK